MSRSIFDKSCFLKIKCKKCRNEQITFNRPAMDVKCLVCDTLLVECTGGKGIFLCTIVNVLDKGGRPK